MMLKQKSLRAFELGELHASMGVSFSDAWYRATALYHNEENLVVLRWAYFTGFDAWMHEAALASCKRAKLTTLV